MEALRLLFKKLPCCYWKTSSRDKTGIAKCFSMVIKEISEFKVLQPWTSQIKKSTLGSKWSNQEFKFFDWKKVEKAWLCYFNFWSKEYLQKIDPFIIQTFWNFGIFCAPSLFRKSGQNYHEIHVFRFFPLTTSPCLKIQVTLITSLFHFWDLSQKARVQTSTLSISMCREEGLNGRALPLASFLLQSPARHLLIFQRFLLLFWPLRAEIGMLLVNALDSWFLLQLL